MLSHKKDNNPLIPEYAKKRGVSHDDGGVRKLVFQHHEVRQRGGSVPAHTGLDVLLTGDY